MKSMMKSSRNGLTIQFRNPSATLTLRCRKTTPNKYSTHDSPNQARNWRARVKGDWCNPSKRPVIKIHNGAKPVANSVLKKLMDTLRDLSPLMIDTKMCPAPPPGRQAVMNSPSPCSLGSWKVKVITKATIGVIPSWHTSPMTMDLGCLRCDLKLERSDAHPILKLKKRAMLAIDHL